MSLLSPTPLTVLGLLLLGGGAAAGVSVGWWLRGRRPPEEIGLDPADSRHVGMPASEGLASEHDGAPALRELLAAAAEHADELISIMLPHGMVTHANGAFCRAVGCDLDSLRRLTVSELLAEPSRPSLSEIETAVRTEGGWRGTLVRRRRDGTTFLSSCTALALRDNAGAVSHFVAVERDVTHETQLREQLIHSERLAAVGQLVSGVAHELNNPLQSIIGFTELLIEAERRIEPRSDLEQVRASAHRAAKIVRNLLSFVRRSAAERAPASLNELVQATVALRAYELSIVGISLEEDYATELPPVLVNREEIQQVLLNLVLNAEQAMKATGRPGRLGVRTFLAPEGVTIEVEDNGPGVPATVAGRIFEPFYSTKGVGEGTGLGLSIALGIAEAHGGTLTLPPGQGEGGARFRLTLPPAESSAEAVRVPADAVVTWAAVPGRRALVADDEPALRKLLHRLLTRRGFAVDLAVDGRQASAMLEACRYDVILCDGQMPHMTGTQLYDSLRRRQPHMTSAFVLISGDILKAPLQSFVESSQIPLLSKPFGARNLDLVLEAVLKRRMKGLDPPAAAHAEACAS